MTVLIPGMRVSCRDAEWMVTRVEQSSSDGVHNTVYCVGADPVVQGHEAIFLTQLDTVTPVDPAQIELEPDQSGGFLLSRLFMEAQLRQMPLTDPFAHPEGMGAFRPMPYQVEAVQHALNQVRPRLLLADAVGLGKTIEVGMILSELMRRGRARRILVLAKKSMLAQFQAELWNRFAIPLIRLDSVGLAKLRLRIPTSKNPFEIYHRIIMSIDTLKDTGRYRHFLENTRWDVVVIDEAHNVAGASVPDQHLSYRLARLLARRTDSLLLTTATPHNGKRETFARLISLLDPSAIADPRGKEYGHADIAPYFLMRFKEDVRHQAGKYFSERLVIPPSQTTCSANEEEESILTALSEWRGRFGTGSASMRSLLQWGLYKQFLSSPEACLASAKTSLANLSGEAAAERTALENLKARLQAMALEQSSRFQLLLRELATLRWTGKAESPRILIFTESRKTQDALLEVLARRFDLEYSFDQEAQPSASIACIHGGMSDHWQAKTVESFGTGTSPMRMLIATDVAAEGVNLHHECHHLIHYDLPWSIITLIQRNGRIDRFGQERQPVIRYLLVDTRQEKLRGDRQIFGRLIEKVEEINRSTRTGESVLHLYDPEKEAEFIASEGLLKGNGGLFDSGSSVTGEAKALEDTLQKAEQARHQEYLDFLEDFAAVQKPESALSATPVVPSGASQEATRKPATPETEPVDTSRIRLMKDVEFLKAGIKLLEERGDTSAPKLTESGELLLLEPSEKLLKRFGWARNEVGVHYGSTALPSEVLEGGFRQDGAFHLSANPERVERAIEAALNFSGQWSREQLLNESHPLLKWLEERILMQIPRGRAPLVVTPHLQPKELCFCFIGQFSSKASTPLLVDAHAISFLPGGAYKERPLREALDEARLDRLANRNLPSRLGNLPIQGFLQGAVAQSLERLKRRMQERQKLWNPIVQKQEKRLEAWARRRREFILEGAGEDVNDRQRRELEFMEAFLDDWRRHWKQAHFDPASHPTTRLVLILEGAAEKTR